MYCFSRTEISIPCWLADLFNLWRFGSVSLDSRLERTRTTLFTAGGCGHCSLGSQFEELFVALYMAAGLFSTEGDGLGEAAVEEDG